MYTQFNRRNKWKTLQRFMLVGFLFVLTIFAGFTGHYYLESLCDWKAPEQYIVDKVTGKEALEKQYYLSQQKVTEEQQKTQQEQGKTQSLEKEVNRLTTKPEYTYSMKTWIYDLCKRYGDKYGVPKEVWYPIVMMESGGNPSATTISRTEDSRGLLQVNTYVHPIGKSNAYNPEANLAYQMPELGVKYHEAKLQGLKGFDVVCYVERYGQRCQWTNKVKSELKKYYVEITGGK